MKKIFLLIFLIFAPMQAIIAEDYDFEDEEGFFDEEPKEVIADPLVFVNRPIFKFNDFIFTKGVMPVLKVYRKVTPRQFRTSVGNFFSNLKSPLYVLNNALQGKFKEAGKQTGRFIVNSTIGICGLFDPAGNKLNLPKRTEDFGQTLGKWGIGPGFYVQMPFMGPTNLRDFISSIFNGYLSGDNYLFPHNPEYFYGAKGLSLINGFSETVPMIEMMKQDALDPYTYTRDGWSQYREKQVQD